MDVKEIEKAIVNLPPTDIAELAKWFEEFHAQVWDEQIVSDMKAGRLRSLLEEAKEDFESNRCNPLRHIWRPSAFGVTIEIYLTQLETSRTRIFNCLRPILIILHYI